MSFEFICDRTYVKDLRWYTSHPGILNVVRFGHLVLVAFVECIGVQHHQTERQDVRMIYSTRSNSASPYVNPSTHLR